MAENLRYERAAASIALMVFRDRGFEESVTRGDVRGSRSFVRSDRSFVGGRSLVGANLSIARASGTVVGASLSVAGASFSVLELDGLFPTPLH